MTTLVSLDGGNRKANDRACYAANFYGGELGGVGEFDLEDARLAGRAGTRPGAVAVERPDYLKANVPPSIIFGLAWNVCRVAYTLAAGAPVHEYTVNAGIETDWIGGTKKQALHLRIWRALSASERKAFPEDTEEWIDQAAEKGARRPGSRPWEHKAFNTLDAAGVGLFHLGRIKKGGAKP